MSIHDPQTDPSLADQPWTAVARLLRPQGRRGELLAEPLSDREGIFHVGQNFRIIAGSAGPLDPLLNAARQVTLEACWRPMGRNAGKLVLKLSGVDSIDAAESLEGRELSLREDLLPPLAEDTFLVRDLVGCTLLDGDRPLGTITDLQFPIGSDGHTRLPDAVDLLVLTPAGADPGAEPVLVPFVKAWLESVDVAEKRIVMHLPAGLVDLPQDMPTEPGSPEDGPL